MTPPTPSRSPISDLLSGHSCSPRRTPSWTGAFLLSLLVAAAILSILLIQSYLLIQVALVLLHSLL